MTMTIVYGPRSSGKSFVAQSLFQGYGGAQVVRIEHPQTMAEAIQVTKDALSAATGFLVLDCGANLIVSAADLGFQGEVFYVHVHK